MRATTTTPVEEEQPQSPPQTEQSPNVVERDYLCEIIEKSLETGDYATALEAYKFSKSE